MSATELANQANPTKTPNLSEDDEDDEIMDMSTYFLRFPSKQDLHDARVQFGKEANRVSDVKLRVMFFGAFGLWSTSTVRTLREFEKYENFVTGVTAIFPPLSLRMSVVLLSMLGYFHGGIMTPDLLDFLTAALGLIMIIFNEAIGKAAIEDGDEKSEGDNPRSSGISVKGVVLAVAYVVLASIFMFLSVGTVFVMFEAEGVTSHEQVYVTSACVYVSWVMMTYAAESLATATGITCSCNFWFTVRWLAIFAFPVASTPYMLIHPMKPTPTNAAVWMPDYNEFFSVMVRVLMHISNETNGSDTSSYRLPQDIVQSLDMTESSYPDGVTPMCAGDICGVVAAAAVGKAEGTSVQEGSPGAFVCFMLAIALYLAMDLILFIGLVVFKADLNQEFNRKKAEIFESVKAAQSNTANKAAPAARPSAMVFRDMSDDSIAEALYDHHEGSLLEAVMALTPMWEKLTKRDKLLQSRQAAE